MHAGPAIAPWKIASATRALARGGIIAYPTEAVYGLGCLPERRPVERLLSLKRRSPRKGLILVAATAGQLTAYVDFDDSRIDYEQVLASWPGPVTWLLPARRGIPRWLTGDHVSLAVRVSAHPAVQALCRRSGAIISTSANTSARPPARSALQVRACFGRKLDYVLSGRSGGQSKPTEIRDGFSGAVVRSAAG